MADDSAFVSGQFDPPSLLRFVAVEVEFPSGFLRFIDGAGEVLLNLRAQDISN